MSGRLDRDSAHYKIGPLTTYVDAAELERRFRKARAGERVTYAIGPAVSLTAATAALVRAWHDEGLCHLLRERENDGRGFRYFLQKRHGATTSANSAAVACPIEGRPEARLLQVLADIAEGGGPLPSLDLLADRAELPTRNAADYRLRLLVEGGFVRVRREGLNRYVDILRQEASL
ncbi:hypothetical protein GR702_17585 [Novosphingobium sp. FGD1]|uniref:LexA repressor DNA-binding domain-containing protein n=1 Tax=Novosphingobium silvae TaxID=2692619 RepID=A0A7X4K7Y5_9SPHN|nr:helix-turn-helix transcriptional regulator [Novosphingobium silvae]MYL99576.1 hypothetical protein [Novosphingobium silvae]